MIKTILSTVKSIIFDDPAVLFRKERHLLDKPFHFEGSNRMAVLLIHGWTTVPYELRRLGGYLNEKGYTASAPMLRGHGTVPRDLEGVVWRDWLDDVEKSFDFLRGKYEKVYIVGTSMGATLAMLLAKERDNIDGIVLMATPYRLKKEELLVAFGRFLSFFKKYLKKSYPLIFRFSPRFVTRVVSYQSYPIKSAFELYAAIKEARRVAPEIKTPCLAMQSSSDHIVSKNNLEELFESIGSKSKKKKYIEKSYHTFISDIKSEHVFKDVLDFIKEN